MMTDLQLVEGATRSLTRRLLKRNRDSAAALQLALAEAVADGARRDLEEQDARQVVETIRPALTAALAIALRDPAANGEIFQPRGPEPASPLVRLLAAAIAKARAAATLERKTM